MPGAGRTLRVRTKTDLPEGSAAAAADLGVCALDGHNLGALREAIADAALGASDATPPADAIPAPDDEATNGARTIGCQAHRRPRDPGR